MKKQEMSKYRPNAKNQTEQLFFKFNANSRDHSAKYNFLHRVIFYSGH